MEKIIEKIYDLLGKLNKEKNKEVKSLILRKIEELAETIEDPKVRFRVFLEISESF